MFARPGLQSASSCSGGSSAQPSFTTGSKPVGTLNSSSTPSTNSGGNDTGSAVLLADRFQNIGQVARILARVAHAQSALHAQGELPGDVDLAAMVHLAQDMTASLRVIQDLKANLRQQQTPSSCLSSVPSSVPSSVQRRKRQTTTPRRPKRCVECCTTQTPEWRNGPEGPRSLCNVCGLLYAKYLRKQRLRSG